MNLHLIDDQDNIVQSKYRRNHLSSKETKKNLQLVNVEHSLVDQLFVLMHVVELIHG